MAFIDRGLYILNTRTVLPSEIEHVKDDFEDHTKRMPELVRSARSAIIDDRYPARKPRHEFTVSLCHLAQSLVHGTFYGVVHEKCRE